MGSLKIPQITLWRFYAVKCVHDLVSLPNTLLALIMRQKGSILTREIVFNIFRRVLMILEVAASSECVARGSGWKAGYTTYTSHTVRPTAAASAMTYCAETSYHKLKLLYTLANQPNIRLNMTPLPAQSYLHSNYKHLIMTLKLSFQKCIK